MMMEAPSFVGAGKGRKIVRIGQLEVVVVWAADVFVCPCMGEGRRARRYRVSVLGSRCRGMLSSLAALLRILMGIDKEMGLNKAGNGNLVDEEEIVYSCCLHLSTHYYEVHVLDGCTAKCLAVSLCVDVTHRVKSGLSVSCKGSKKTNPTTWQRAV